MTGNQRIDEVLKFLEDHDLAYKLHTHPPLPTIELALEYWKDIVSNLRLVGYDHVLSIEHEDSLMSQNEGLSKAVEMLKRVLIKENPAEMWWA